LDIPALHFPSSGNFAVTFAFGAQSDKEEIKKKFQEWGIVGHNGLDFGLTAGFEKRKVGAKVIEKCAYIQTRDNFALEALDWLRKD